MGARVHHVVRCHLDRTELVRAVAEEQRREGVVVRHVIVLPELGARRSRDFEDAEAVAEILKTTMEGIAPDLGISLRVDVSTGKNWGEL